MTACFRKTSAGVFVRANSVPCPGSQDAAGHSSCCYREDQCLSNGMCHYTHPWPNGSGYYLRECTDASYNDTSACQQICIGEGVSDVVYNYQAQLWLCCGSDSKGNVVCNTPTNISFNAPPPNQLTLITNTTTTISSIPAAYSATSTSTNTNTNTNTSSTSNSAVPNRPQSSGLSSTAAIHIGVGIAIGVLFLLLVLFLVWRRGQRQRRTRNMLATSYNVSEMSHGNDFNGVDARHYGGLGIAKKLTASETWEQFGTPIRHTGKAELAA